MENRRNIKKDALLRFLSDIEHNAQSLVSKGREIVKHWQFIADSASCHADFVRCAPDDSFFTSRLWDDQITSLDELCKSAVATITTLNVMPQLVFATNATSLAASTAISSVYIPFLPSSSQGPARKAYERFEQLLEQANQVEELETEILRLGLTSSRAGNESILSLLHQAVEAFKAPSIQDVSPSAVLIPLREAISLTLADILPRRPHQEKTKGHREKVRSVCNQCGHLGVNATQIEQLANEAHYLNDQLSQAKQGAMTRDRVRELLNKGVLFLRSFFRVLDENKMRR